MRTLTPGPFPLPGDLAGSPLLTSSRCHQIRPGLRATPSPPCWRGASRAIRPRRAAILSRHFSRLDRQIVLVDALGALNAGPDSTDELQVALEAVLRIFPARRRKLARSALGRGAWTNCYLPPRRPTICTTPAMIASKPRSALLPIARLIRAIVPGRLSE